MEKITWRTEQRRLGDLIEWEKNPRQLSAHDAKHIKISLDKFGLADPLVINADNHLIGGHQRKHILADPDTLVDVRVPSRQLSEAEAEELGIRLNKAQGSWDFDALANGFEFDELIEWGFTEQELTGLDFGGDEPPDDPGAQVDRAEELREKWGVVSGQLWKLGEHRLICGDCTDRAVVERVMENDAELLFTSPPYLDARDYGGNDLELDKIIGFIPVFADRANLICVNLGIVRKDNEIVRYWDSYIDEAENCGLKLLSWNVWDRQQPWSMAQNTAMFPIEHEWVFVFGRSKKELNLTVENKTPGTRTGITNRQKDGTLKRAEPKEVRTHRPLGTLFRSPPHIGSDIGHPAMFPVVFPEAYIEACTNPGDIVAEPFCGSGTTIVSCEQTGRRCRAVEISPAYCAVAIERWVTMTGGTPELLD